MVRPASDSQRSEGGFLDSDVLNFRSNSERMEGLISPASHLYSRGCDVEEDCGEECRRIDTLAPGHGRARGDLPSLRGGRCDGRRARQADIKGSAIAAVHDVPGRHDLVYVVQTRAGFRRRRR